MTRATTVTMRRGARGLVLLLVAIVAMGATARSTALSDLRVRSDDNLTIVEAWVGQPFLIEDRTRDSHPVVSAPPKPPPTTAEDGPRPPTGVSSAETFADEIRLHMPELPPTRATSIIVGDPLVSEVRVLAERVGSALIIFVRRPVVYQVLRTAGGRALRVDVRPRPVPVRPGKRQIVPTGGGLGEVTLDAETVNFDRPSNTIIASGGVAITRPGTVLRADEVRVHRSTYEGRARGNVVMETGDTTIRGDYLQIDLDDETGWVEHGEIDLETTGFVVLGDRIEKGHGQHYSVDNSILTTCKCGGLDPPSWSLAADKLDIDVLGNGRARNITFRVQDKPIFYFPYGIFPVNRERHSGFLLPRVGQSFGTNGTGFEYEQPFFWAINKSSDTTAAFHIETAARVGGVLEYRYSRDPESDGTISAAYFNETLRSDSTPTFETENQRIVESAPENRWGVYSDSRQGLPGGATAYADTMAVSDDLFFREIDSASFQPAEEAATRTLFYTASRYGAIKAWDQASVSGEGTYYQDLDLTRSHEDDGVLQRVPSLDLRARRTVWNRLGLTFAGGGVHYARDTGFDGVRADAHPQVRLPFNFNRFLFGALEGGVRGTAYHTTDRDRIGQCRGEGANEESCVTDADCPGMSVCQTNYRCKGGANDGQACGPGTTCPGGQCLITPTGTLPNSTEVRGLVHFRGNLGTEVSRAYDFQRWGFQRLKHTIEPILSYLYVPRINQDDLPLYDGVDRINRRSMLSYGLISRVIARGGTYAPLDRPNRVASDDRFVAAPAVREVLRASVLQVYDTERTISDGEHFSDIDLGLRLTPGNLVALNYGATYNPQDNDFRATSVGLLLREPFFLPKTRQSALLRQPSTLSLTYRFIADGAAAATSVGVEDLTGSVYLRLARFLGLLLQTRYDVRNNTLLEFGAGARFISQCDCWSFEVGFDQRAEPERTAFRAQLVLSGIGSIGRSSDGEFVTVPGFRQGEFFP
jgi:LPS-assembly protein